MNPIAALLLLSHVIATHGYDWSSLDLVRSHIPYVFNHHSQLKQACLEDSQCPFKELINNDQACWGFEPRCKDPFGKSNPTLDCAKEDSKNRYWRQGDFGYLQDRLDELKSRVICKSSKQKNSSLRCTRVATMCEARNLYIDLRSINERTIRGDKVVLQDGEIGGYCDLDKPMLGRETAVKRDLSSWGEQLGSYSELPFDPFEDPDHHCDVLVKDPVIFVQLDFGGNMYHHFCDFFNLYLTQLANNSWFGTDNTIIRWSSSPHYGDLFKSSWKVFTNKDHISLAHYRSKRVCFSQATFAFLPRMAFGLFYSTFLEVNCRGTRLFQAFSEHFLYRIGTVDQHLVPRSPNYRERPSHFRVTMLDRGHTDKYKIYRRVINQDELVAALRKIPDLEVQVIKYGPSIPFEEQLLITRTTDIFIGMHGAGLAHFLFLPDWAIAFELYNCGDLRCYRDLAHLRGLRYITWEDESKLKPEEKSEVPRHETNRKFWNFSFDVDEFIRLINKARHFLFEHSRFSHLKRRDEL